MCSFGQLFCYMLHDEFYRTIMKNNRRKTKNKPANKTQILHKKNDLRFAKKVQFYCVYANNNDALKAWKEPKL